MAVRRDDGARPPDLDLAYPESVVLAGTGIDLAEARKLVTRGCPVETASRILL